MNYTIELLYFAGTLCFMTVNFAGWTLMQFYRPKAYVDNFEMLFPAQKIVALLYVVQLCQFPYLMHIGEADFLIYVNTFSLLSFSSILAEMYDAYFFLNFKTPRQRTLYYLPICVVLVVEMFTIYLPEGLELTMNPGVKIGILALFSFYFYRTLRIAWKLKNIVRKLNEEIYSNPDNFPTRLAEKILWTATSVCVILATNFVIETPLSKFVCDVLLISVCFWFTILTLNPWRKVFPANDQVKEMDSIDNQPTHLLGRARLEQFTQQMKVLLEDEHLYTDPNLTIDRLTTLLNTNRTYMNEVIQHAGYKSFFDMINRHRVEYAAKLLICSPSKSMFDIANESGFSSQSYMSRTFKLYKEVSPRIYRLNHKE